MVMATHWLNTSEQKKGTKTGMCGITRARERLGLRGTQLKMAGRKLN